MAAVVARQAAAASACYFAQWNMVANDSDLRLVERIRQAGVHVLIDIAGHTNKSRLTAFAWKPAPLQVAWLGYCASTGLDEIDYVIGDPIATPDEDATHFCEKIFHSCNRRQRVKRKRRSCGRHTLTHSR